MDNPDPLDTSGPATPGAGPTGSLTRLPALPARAQAPVPDPSTGHTGAPAPPRRRQASAGRVRTPLDVHRVPAAGRDAQ
ncbi:hypothetical protein SAMN05421505_11882 [Sinosporangium album]|uniref:Uncharacterized protein n=1 Tax=Sinosporangium album TaxID=504805 RepID=A0A1G8DK05_9ACTN|nr:hypothetical protein [Sinosporangium album]SDH58023.1 hypothetical protein SAMN05421505_11882 [Sinosporangium album]